jgi:hypothetical protein
VWYWGVFIFWIFVVVVVFLFFYLIILLFFCFVFFLVVPIFCFFLGSIKNTLTLRGLSIKENTSLV